MPLKPRADASQTPAAGLTEPWYIQTQGYTIVATQSNPALLEAGLAISLALGVAANVCLLARFLEFRPKRYTLLAILALSLHDAINIAAVTWFGVSKRHPDGFNYGGPFWLTVASTVVSFICNITLVVDLVRTRNFVRKGALPDTVSGKVSADASPLFRIWLDRATARSRHYGHDPVPLHWCVPDSFGSETELAASENSSLASRRTRRARVLLSHPGSQLPRLAFLRRSHNLHRRFRKSR